MENELLIKAEGLTKEYATGTAVSDASFEIHRGRIYGLIGPNGAGKTTIMKMIGDLIIPTSGKITMYRSGKVIKNDDARRYMSFMIETPYLRYEQNAVTNLEGQCVLRGIKDKSRIGQVLEDVGLSDIPKKKHVSKFSLGMRQRLGIAAALLPEPEVMILDEPTNGLDPKGIVEIRELLLKLNHEKNITIIISSHILSELAKLCTDYIFIDHGRMIKTLTDDELHVQTGNDLLMRTNDDDRAEKIFTEKLGSDRFKRHSQGFRIYSGAGQVGEISGMVCENGIIPLHISEDETNLEEYYMSLLRSAAVEKPEV